MTKAAVPEIIYDDSENKEKLKEFYANMGMEYPESDYNKIVSDVVKEAEEAEKTRKEETEISFEESLIKEDEFLDAFPEKEKAHEFYIPYNGRYIPIEVKMITPEAIKKKEIDSKLLDVEKDLFSDISKGDQEVLEKYNKKEKLNKKEKAVIKRITKIQNDATAESLHKMNKLLAQHVLKFGPENIYYNKYNKKERLAFWETGAGNKFMFKVTLHQEVLNIIGMTQGSMIKVFRLSELPTGPNNDEDKPGEQLPTETDGTNTQT